MHFRKGALIASAVASLFAAGCATDKNRAGETTRAVRCAGINDCKGHGSCGAANACKGQNGCKGQGWLEVATEGDCTSRGGTVLAAK